MQKTRQKAIIFLASSFLIQCTLLELSDCADAD